MNKDEKGKLDEARSYGSQFLDCVCEDCRSKIEPFFKKNLVKILIRPKKYQEKMASMLCETCKKNLMKKAQRVR